MKKILPVVFALLCGQQASAQSDVAAVPLSLDAAIRYAIQHSATVRNASIDVRLQKAKNDEITAIALPQINGEAQFTDYINPVVSFLPAEFLGGAPGTFTPLVFTPQFSNSIGVTGSQILFDGSVIAALQARKALILLAQKNVQLSVQDVRYNVIRAYYGLVIAQKQFEILQGSIALARDANNDVRALRDAGFAEKIDVDRSAVQLNNLVTDSIRIGNLLEVGQQLLKFQMSMPISTPIVLTDTALENQAATATQLLANELDYTRRIEVDLLNTQLELQGLNLKRQRYSAFPTLAAFGNASYNYSTSQFSELFNSRYPFTFLAGLKLSVPIFNGFARKARVRQAKLDMEKTVNSIGQAKLGIDFQVAQSRTVLRNALLTLQSQRRNLDLANSVLDLARRKYKAGVGSNLEVTQAQGDLLLTQNNYFNALLEAINAQTDVQKALGDFAQ